jgi:radical SAM protein with 4Fe4S-binding SPASM domain
MGALLSIEPSGVVYSCKASSAYFGNMNEFDKIFNSKTYLRYAQHPFERKSTCINCELENFCSNICAGPREKNFCSISKMHKQTCKLNKQLIKKLIKNMKKNELVYFQL